MEALYVIRSLAAPSQSLCSAEHSVELPGSELMVMTSLYVGVKIRCDNLVCDSYSENQNLVKIVR